MSEDDIDNLIDRLVRFVEQEDMPRDWPDDDALYDKFKEICYDWGDPFYTKERNYN